MSPTFLILFIFLLFVVQREWFNGNVCEKSEWNITNYYYILLCVLLPIINAQDGVCETILTGRCEISVYGATSLWYEGVLILSSIVLKFVWESQREFLCMSACKIWHFSSGSFIVGGKFSSLIQMNKKVVALRSFE